MLLKVGGSFSAIHRVNRIYTVYKGSLDWTVVHSVEKNIYLLVSQVLFSAVK